jgi:hypothetical protein
MTAMLLRLLHLSLCASLPLSILTFPSDSQPSATRNNNISFLGAKLQNLSSKETLNGPRKKKPKLFHKIVQAIEVPAMLHWHCGYGETKRKKNRKGSKRKTGGECKPGQKQTKQSTIE